MQCPRCQHKNPPGQKFCGECGTPAAGAASARPYADLEHENEGLTRSLAEARRREAEALEQQTATSEILRVIASSPTDLQPVLDAMAESAARVCGADDAAILRLDGDVLHSVAHHGPILYVPGLVVPAIRGTVTGRSVLDRQTVQVADLRAEAQEFPESSTLGRELGHRTILSVPLLREGVPIGAILLRRTEVQPFTDKQIALLKTFADQAVIAIQNVRLFNELEARNRDLTTALDRQTATSEILRVISDSPTDVQPVFDTIVQSAARLCHAANAGVFLTDGRTLDLPANYGSSSPEVLATIRAQYPRPLDRETTAGVAILTRSVVHVPDVEAPSAAEIYTRRIGRLLGVRSMVAVPMTRKGEVVGAINLSRLEPGRFSDMEVELLKIFADQAVIALENVRLFKELEARNRDLTATGEILQIIARSPTDVQPVFDTIAESALRLCGAYDSTVLLLDGQNLRLVAHDGPIPSITLLSVVRGTVGGRAVLERQPVHVEDVQAEVEEFPEASAKARQFSFRTIVSVPLLREGQAIGILQLRRTEVAAFSDRQIELLKTFADQAVIAIENVRLFNELKEKNRALTDALEQQTATSEILSVISQSPTDVQPVFDTIVQSGARLCNATTAAVVLTDGTMMRVPANYGSSPEVLAAARALWPRPLDVTTAAGMAILTRSVVQIADSEDPSTSEFVRQSGRLLGYRSSLAVPMLRGAEAIGAIRVTRRESGRFSDAEIELLKTFADQAVIAIQNVRLFTELQEKNRALTEAHSQVTEALDRQTATSEILGVISRSPTDAQAVFDAIARSAVTLTSADVGGVLRTDGRQFYLAALHGEDRARLEAIRRQFESASASVDSASLGGRVILSQTILHVPDMEALPSPPPASLEFARAVGFRSQVIVPMLRGGETIGAIAVGRLEPGPFSDSHIALLKTFADQAVIAIENVRLFNETKEALDRQTATSEILSVISSSPTISSLCWTPSSRAPCASAEPKTRPSPNSKTHTSGRPPTMARSPSRSAFFAGSYRVASVVVACLSGEPFTRPISWPTQRSFPKPLPGLGSTATGRCSACPSCERVRRSARYIFGEQRSTRSPISKSASSRPSPTRPSSPSRTCGCSVSFRRGLANSRAQWKS
jgi:GAF domain-containing protein